MRPLERDDLNQEVQDKLDELRGLIVEAQGLLNELPELEGLSDVEDSLSNALSTVDYI